MGVLGAVLIVGSMVAFIEIELDAASPTGDDGSPVDGITGPPPELGKTSWRASGCEAVSLVWNPPLSSLEAFTGPWEPAEGPLPGRGIFVLFAYRCPRAALDGLAIGPPSGAAAIIPIQEPDDERNVTARTGWSAIPEWVGAAGSSVFEAFAEHGFNVVPGSGSVSSSDALAGTQVRMVVETEAGRLEATSLITGSSQARDVQGGLVSTNEETFGVFSGPESMQRQTSGQAVVRTSGTTWVERLGLEAAPQSVAYDTQMQWDFTIFSEPFDAS